MTAPLRRGIGAFLALVLVALLAGAAGAGGAGAGPADDKREEAASIAAKLDEQARGIVELDKERRRAVDRLADADGAVARAEADLAAAERRQDEARRLLAAHAQAAYVGGGSVSFLGQMARATVTDAGARRTYLGVAANEDRQAIGRLRATREDITERRKSLADARKAAAAKASAAEADVARLEQAAAGQRALLVKVNGDLAQLVVAEQARRDAETARLAAARQAAAAAPPAAASLPAPAAGPSAAPGAVAAVAGVVATVAPALAPSPAPAAGDSRDATFACIRQLESGNNYKSPGGGAYQFQDATWHSLGYSGTASDYPPAVQDEAARKLQSQSGWGPWTTAPLCGRV
jgi:peptidoglycan hydrolase CwlO-like protein